MKEYPVGSICYLVGLTYLTRNNGRECMILESQKERLVKDPAGNLDVDNCYLIHVNGDELPSAAHHVNLKLKKFPPDVDAWCKEKMKDLLNPKMNNILNEEIV